MAMANAVVAVGVVLMGGALAAAQDSKSKAGFQAVAAHKPVAQGAFSGAFQALAKPAPGTPFPGAPLGGKPGQPFDGTGDAGAADGAAGAGHEGAWQGWWNGGALPVQIPLYAPQYGVTPGHFPEWNVKRSSASVTYRTAGGGEQQISARPAYVDAIGAAVERLHGNEQAGAFMQQGVASFRGRDYLAAAENFRRAVPLDPDNGLPRFAHGFAQFALGDYDGAAYSIRRGLDLLPDWNRSGQDLAAWYGAPLDLQDQLEALRSHCRLQRDDGEARAVLGYVELFTGDLERAAVTLEQVAAQRPDDPLPRHFLAEIERVRRG